MLNTGAPTPEPVRKTDQGLDERGQLPRKK
jgi:hypothetical protein